MLQRGNSVDSLLWVDLGEYWYKFYVNTGGFGLVLGFFSPWVKVPINFEGSKLLTLASSQSPRKQVYIPKETNINLAHHEDSRPGGLWSWVYTHSEDKMQFVSQLKCWISQVKSNMWKGRHRSFQMCNAEKKIKKSSFCRKLSVNLLGNFTLLCVILSRKCTIDRICECSSLFQGRTFVL